MKKFIEVPEMLQTEDPNANGASLIRGLETLFTVAARLASATTHEKQDEVAVAFVKEVGITGAVAMQADIMSLVEGGKILQAILFRGTKLAIAGDKSLIPTPDQVAEWQNEQRAKGSAS